MSDFKVGDTFSTSIDTYIVIDINGSDVILKGLKNQNTFNYPKHILDSQFKPHTKLEKALL